MKSAKYKFITSPFWLFGIVSCILLLYFLYILVFYISSIENLERTPLITIISMRVTFGILPTIMLILFSNHCFSVVTIDEKGFHKSLFKYLFRQDYSWDDIKQLRIVHKVDNWLFIVKNDIAEDIDYYKLIKQKDILQMSFRPTILKAIRQYSDMKIINLDKN